MDDSPKEDMQKRTEVRDVLQNSLVHDPRAEEAQGSVITAWVVCIEVMQTDGSKYLLRVSGDAADGNLTAWTRDGLYHAALDRDWNDET